MQWVMKLFFVKPLISWRCSDSGARLRRAFLSAGLFLLTGPLTAAVVLQIGQNFTGTTFGTDSQAQPADGNGAVGPQHFVEFVNGRFSVYDKATGNRVRTMSDMAFWTNAGVTFGATIEVTDPRTVYDTYSQRWFMSQVDANVSSRRQQANRFLLAVSDSADPTGTWHAFAFIADPVHQYFADFPTLGVDAQGVYLGGDLFRTASSSAGPTLVAIPKSGLLATPPSIVSRTSLGQLTYSSRGEILQPAITTGAASGDEVALAVGNLGLDLQLHTTLIGSILHNNDTAGKATLGTAHVFTVPGYTVPINPAQPDGSNNLDDGDARFSASVRRVGNILYAVHGGQVNGHAAIRWYRIDAQNMVLLQAGTVADPSLDLYYPSIAANDAGVVVIACNGSSADVYVSSYATIGETVNGVLAFNNGLTLLQAGLASYQSTDFTGSSRWGDYSATSVDPEDPSRFWTIQTYAVDTTVWATQITELIAVPLRLTVQILQDNVQVSWPASATGVALQFSPNLSGASNWTPVSQSPVTANNQAVVTLPSTGPGGFFRLAAP